jgi:ComF family protein
VLDLLLPQRCLICSAPGAQMCGKCTTTLRRIEPPLCERCGNPTAWPVRRCSECDGRRLAFARARAAVEYDASVRSVVAAWKERGLRLLAAWAAAVVVEGVPRPDATTIVCVPSDSDRRLRRGHHAAERLALELSGAWAIPVMPLLERTRASSRQRGKSRVERRRNVRGAFHAAVAPARIVLVDDVYTTGATADAAASALRRAGAHHVEVVTFARTIRIR